MNRSRIFVVLLVAAGYLAAVVVAVFVTVAVIILPTVLPDEGLFGSFFRVIRDASTMLLVGFVWTFVCAFPGFVVAIVLGEWLRWNRWHVYALAGLLNVPPSLLVFSVLFGSPFEMPSMIYSSFPGGFAGGAAYWFATGRLVARRRDATDPNAA